jgi:hypothetical protein
LDTREELNRRLANGELGGSLLRWLNGLSAARELQRAEGAAESNLVQAKIFHRGGAEARRESEVGESARERMEMSCGARRGDSNLGGFAALRGESEIFGANRRIQPSPSNCSCSGGWHGGGVGRNAILASDDRSAMWSAAAERSGLAVLPPNSGFLQRMYFVHSELRDGVGSARALGNGWIPEEVQPSPSNIFFLMKSFFRASLPPGGRRRIVRGARQIILRPLWPDIRAVLVERCWDWARAWAAGGGFPLTGAKASAFFAANCSVLVRLLV